MSQQKQQRLRKRRSDSILRKKVIEYVNSHENFTTLGITMYFRNQYDTLSVLLVLEELYMNGLVDKR